MISLQAQFPGITPAHSEAILAIIGRFNPDFNVRAPWGISKLSPEKIAGVEAQLGRAFNPLSVEDHLFAMYSVFHTEVVKNNAIRSFADQVKQLHSSNPLSDKTIDIEAQVYALYYVFISHTEPVTEIDEKDFEEFSELLLKRLWRIPTQSEIIDTYRNYRLLESLKAKGILPVNEIISKDALVTTQDFLSYFYDLVDEIGIPKIRLAVPLAVTGPSLFSKTLKYMGNFFRKRESVRELANGTRLVTTWCMQTVRYGFSRIYGFTLGGYGDMVDIYKEGVDVYAEKVKQAFTAAGKGSAFIGYDPDFSKTHMNAPADANIAMVFPDTTRRQWGRMVGGHVAFAYKNAQGSWLVYDEYYQGWLGPLKKIEEYYSEKNGGLWHSHNLKDTERIKGAIFFKWPLPDFIQQAK